MILIVTNKQDYTADFFILELRKHDIDFIRFNTEDFPTQISVSLEIDQLGFQNSYFNIYGTKVLLKEITGVWYRRPVSPLPSQSIDDPIARDFVIAESEHVLRSVWRLLDCKWVSHPDYLRMAESKPYQLITATKLGFQIPSSLITNESSQAQGFVASNTKSIYKPLQYGHILRDDGVGLVYTNLLEQDHLASFDAVQYSPSMFQEYVPKQSEIRVTVVGCQVFAVELDSQMTDMGKHDWRRANLGDLPHVAVNLPSEVEKLCVSLVKSLNINFGAIDLIKTPDNQYVFLEINPNGQWAWIEQMLPEMKIRNALINLLLQRDEK